MPAEHRHHADAALAAATALAACAGFVDAYVYVRVCPVFVANMSGNLVHLGIDAGVGRAAALLASLVALAAFALGVGSATALSDHDLVAGRSEAPRLALRIEGALIMCAALVLAELGPHGPPRVSAGSVGLLAIAAFAMGMQAAALRRVGQIAVSTTYGTGAVVRLTEKLVLGARRSAPTSSVRRRHSVIVLAVVLIGYVAGATAGAALGRSPVLLAAAALVPFTCARHTRDRHVHIRTRRRLRGVP
jgi:uncharacterized membrane protein YoaK (UPF0700 family)